MKLKQYGFTLVEVMVVVVILGILAAVVVPKVMSRPDQARVVKVKQDILSLENAIELYRLDNGTYPTTDQGLKALVMKPTISPVPTHWKIGGYIKRLPQDPWGRAYQYLQPGQHGDVDIFSLGKSGDAVNQADVIGNWDVDKE